MREGTFKSVTQRTVDTHVAPKMKLEDAPIPKMKPTKSFYNSTHFLPAGPFQKSKVKDHEHKELINSFDGCDELAGKSMQSFQVTHQDAVNAVNYKYHNKFKEAG